MASDIVDAILLKRADGHGGLAQYRNKEDMERLLQQVFEKWQRNGTVWTQASLKASGLSLTSV